MTESEQCPRCTKSLVVHGSIFRSGAFRPEELRLFLLSFQLPEVHVQSGYAACAGCGLVWGELDAAILRQKLHELGNAAVRERLALGD